VFPSWDSWSLPLPLSQFSCSSSWSPSLSCSLKKEVMFLLHFCDARWQCLLQLATPYSFRISEAGIKSDERIITSLVTLIENLLTFQGKTWYNTMLTIKPNEKRWILSCVRDGKFLFQVSYFNSQMVIALSTCIRNCRGQLLQRIWSSYLNNLLNSVK